MFTRNAAPRISRAKGSHARSQFVQARALVDRFQRGSSGREVEPTDAELDAALGLVDPHDTRVDIPPHAATPYAVCRGLFEALQLGADDVVLDLGSGTGRVVVYGALVSAARFVGVEIVEERSRDSARAVRHLGLDRATIITGDVLDPALAHLFASATVFYAFRPFSDDFEQRVFDAINAQGARRRVTVATHRIRPRCLAAELFECVSSGALAIHRSRG